MFGNPEKTVGGQAIRYYTSLRLDIRRIGAYKPGMEVTGNRTRVKTIKNKFSPPFRQAEFTFLYGQGISLNHELINLGVEVGILEKERSQVYYNGERIGRNTKYALDYLEENPSSILWGPNEKNIDVILFYAANSMTIILSCINTLFKRDWSKRITSFESQLADLSLDDVERIDS